MKFELTDAIRLLFDIEAGRVALTPEQEADDIYAGNVTYRTSTGWTVVIFNDCCSFDYVDSINTPDGFTWTCQDVEFFFQYNPPDAVVKNIYRIGATR